MQRQLIAVDFLALVQDLELYQEPMLISEATATGGVQRHQTLRMLGQGIRIVEMVQHIEMHLKKAEDCLFVANRTNKSGNLKHGFFAKIFIFRGEPHVTSSNLWPIIKFKVRPFSIERSYGNKLPGNSEILSTAEFE